MATVAVVEVIQGGTPAAVKVPRGGLVIGRDEGVGLPLDAPSVSKRHARIFWEGDELLVEDLGSTNRVHRDGQAIDVPVPLQDGDELVLGEIVLRVSITGQPDLVPVAALPDTQALLQAPRAPERVDVERRAAELLPIVESFFHARNVQDLGRRLLQAIRANFPASRIAVIEIEQETQRFRVLALHGATDPTFVSRTVVGEAVRRGIALHQLGAAGRLVGSSLLEARCTSAVAAVMRSRGDRIRVIYLDTLASDLATVAPLTYRHAMELQLFASSAAGAFDALALQRRETQERVRFENLRRYFSPSVVEQLSLLARTEKEISAPAFMVSTVLFADLSGLARLADRWRSQPDGLVSVVDLWLEAGSRAVFSHSGTLDKFVGDLIMAVFGAPFPVPEAPLQAVRCALEMRDAVARLSRETGVELQLTAGVNTGSVLACGIGSRRRHEYTVLGQTVNVAARLQERAEPGAIILAEPTASEVASAVELERAGDLQLPNVEMPLRTWRALRLK